MNPRCGAQPFAFLTPCFARCPLPQLLNAIRQVVPHPPVHARNLFHLSICMYNAHGIYSPPGEVSLYKAHGAWPAAETQYIEVIDAAEREAARETAISYAAYRLLRARFTLPNVRDSLTYLMQDLGHDPSFAATGPDQDPRAVGNRIAATVHAAFLDDGSNEAGGYEPTNGYTPTNDPLSVDRTEPFNMADPCRWQPLSLTTSITQVWLKFPGVLDTVHAQLN